MTDVAMGTASGQAQQLLVNDPDDGLDWSNHNDIQLAKQYTVLNLNNRNVRLTIWFLIFMILTTWGAFSNSVMQMQFVEMKDTDTWQDDSTYYDDEIRFFSLSTSTNSIVWWAAAISLCTLYCAFCKCNCNIFCAILFGIGGIMQLSTMFYAIGTFCDYGDDESKSYCRVIYIGSMQLFGLFSIYLGIDCLKPIGNDIRVRLFVKSVLVAIRSFLFGSYYVYLVNQLDDNDTTWWTPRDSQYYQLRTLAGGSINTGIVCVIVAILSITIKQRMKCHKAIPRLLAFFLIVSEGTAAFFWNYQATLWIVTMYHIPAVVLIIYDLQYLF